MAMPPPPALAFAPGQKFVVLTVEEVRSIIKVPRLLADGTSALLGLPLALGRSWEQTIGTMASERLRRANLVFVRAIQGAAPGLDREHSILRSQIEDVFVLLQLSGGIEYSGATMLVGSVMDGKPEIQQIRDVEDFYRSAQAPPIPATTKRLHEAARGALALQAMRATPGEFARIVRGLLALREGLSHFHGQDRLHQFVRALEAVILPDPGKTRKQFVRRCQAFLKPHATAAALLGEAFDMRSDVEHIHAWDRSLQSYPAAQRDAEALHRTRQTEALACYVYRRILADPAIRAHFRTEATQAAFWASADPHRSWGSHLDLTRIR